MLNIILMTFLAPFLPVFLYGNLAQSESATGEIGIVKGEKEEKLEQGESFEKHSFFPIENIASSSQRPTKNEDSGDLKIWAGSSVVIDVESGTILHYDQGRKQTQIASLTKMMTAVLAMENIKDLNEEVVITKESLNIAGTVVGCPTSVFCNANRMYVGEKVKAVDLLKAMLMNSANDAATALSVHMAGSAKEFVKIMNNKAKDMGLKDTNFCTPSGLETDGNESECYSSAYDIARIAAYSLKYEKVWEIMRIPEDRFFSTDGKYMHELKNTDLLLAELPNCIGGKTGFTPLAGKSLLTAATDASQENKIIAVILNDETRWADMKILIDWVFNNYKWQ